MLGRKISIRSSVTAAFEFAKVNAPKTAGVLSIILLLDIATVFAPAPAPGSINPTLVALMGLKALFGVIAQAALYRLAFASEHRDDPEFRIGPMGLQWGRPETRLLGAVLLLVFLYLLVLLFLLIVLIVTLGAGMFVSGEATGGSAPLTPTPQQTQTLLLASLPVLLIALGVYVRICLYGAATVAERKITVFSTWSLTRGHFWPILGAFVVIALPIGVLTLLAAVPGEPRAASIVIELLTCVMDAFLIRPMYCGLYAHIYAALRPGAVVQAGAARGPWG